MDGVKWIKLTTSMFDDEKIRIIESMPDRDAILIIWVKLLVQAGKTNASGYIFLSENIPFTDDMLATLFNRPLNTVRLALETFRRFGMIEIDEEHRISITNWELHQNVDGMDKIREQNRLRKQKQREKIKSLPAPEKESRDSHGTVTEGHATDKDQDLDQEIEREQKKEQIPFVDIIDYLNEKCGTSFKATTKATQEHIRARWREGFRLDDFIRVIDIKASDWKGTEYEQYLRPLTLFGTKFESYLNSSAAGRGSVIGRNTPDGNKTRDGRYSAFYNLFPDD